VNDPHETRPSERIQSSQRTTHEPADELPETDAPSEANPHWDATQLSQNQFWTQKRRLATAMRLVTRRLSRATRPPGGSARRPTPANAMPRPFGSIRASGIRSSAASQRMRGWTHAFFDQSPLIGPANPLAPPLTIDRKGDTHARATDLRLGPGGPTGIGTRGFIAAAFGGGPGTVQSSSGRPGMTGTLTVGYRRPTALHTSALRGRARTHRSTRALDPCRADGERLPLRRSRRYLRLIAEGRDEETPRRPFRSRSAAGIAARARS